MHHEPITVTVLSSTRAAQEVDWDEGDLLYLARREGVLIDADDPLHAEVFGIARYYLPAAWLEEVKARPNDEDGDE